MPDGTPDEMTTIDPAAAYLADEMVIKPVVRKETQRVPVRKMLAMRLKREKRDEAFKKAVADHCKAHPGTSRFAAEWAVAKDFGYVNAETERAIHEEWRSRHEKELAEKRAKHEAKVREKAAGKAVGAVDSYYRAVRTLPTTASPALELEWVRSHPAMSRMARDPNQKRVVLRAQDVLYPPHGPAPSQAAVSMLQHWVNYPMEFFKQVLSEQKKRGQETEEAKAAEKDIGLDEVRRFLKQVTSRKVTPIKENA